MASKYFFNNYDEAYRFQALLREVGVDSDLVNELTSHDYSIKLADSADSPKADDAYGKYFLRKG